MTLLFTVTDPLGRTVVLDDDEWYDHIIIEHPELNARWVAECIRTPDFIAMDAIREQRRVYYKKNFLPLPSIRRYYLKVVTELGTSEDRPCRVITAFVTDEPKMGEKLEWPVQSS